VGDSIQIADRLHPDTEAPRVTLSTATDSGFHFYSPLGFLIFDDNIKS
jgi:hypothetical protein